MLLKGIKNTKETLLKILSSAPLKQIKTYLKSKMGQEMPKVLLLMNAHYAMTVDISTVVDSFARKHSHRMDGVDKHSAD